MASDLSLRRQLILASLKILRDADDPRKDDVVKHYEAQLAEIDRKIAAQPHDIVIQLKPGMVGAKGLGTNKEAKNG
jgi:hypothetical protein